MSEYGMTGKAMTGLVLSLGSLLLASTGVQAQVTRNGAVTTMTVPSQSSQAAGQTIDYAHAKPMPLPTIPAPSTASPSKSIGVDPLMLFGQPGFSEGNVGTGGTNPVQLVPPQDLSQQEEPEAQATPSPQEYGTSLQPYTTSQVNAFNDLTVNYYPYRAAGKLFFNIGNQGFLCSASLIAPGLIVTAAHCVANYGKQQFYSAWQYVPAYNNGTAPYGVWTVTAVNILTQYYNGTDNCAVAGVVCPDDIAVLTVVPQSGTYPGKITGWFGYAWNYGFNSSGQAQLTQLGYPAALDQGVLMERTDALGVIDPNLSNNTVIGSLQTGGSSGGPWLINFGLPPTLAAAINYGSGSGYDWVTHVTSWGYDKDPTIKQQGASPFTDTNIKVLVTIACQATPAACQ